SLSGPIHSKGVYTLSGYLGWRFGRIRPLALSASLTIEQNYGGIEGDSASSTELYAILSDLSNLPIRQEIAVTGSVDQNGHIQPIGGVNEKIEGFFAVCMAQGLTGTQGCMIPRQNVSDLMLSEEVVEAAREGKFHVFAVDTIEDGITLLTQVPSGVESDDS
ncbi:ATP-dependent protease, partial [mine drainage metagenome]